MAKKQSLKRGLYLLAIGLSLCSSETVHAQEPVKDTGVMVQPTDTLLKIDTFVVKKKFWRGAGELMLVQVIPWAYNYYVRDADFARISWESIAYNLKFSNWEWDDNSFQTNQFAHPYHGSLYFSSFRTNGYNFWQSVPAAFAGSYMWEVAGETHPPAPNDFINTSLGGISLGEMSFRLSNSIVNNKQRGFKRQMQEVFAFLVNPLNGFNRILDRRWGRVHYTAGDEKKPDITTQFDIGMRRFSTQIDDVLDKGDNEFYLRLRLNYGGEGDRIKIPFTSFFFNIEVGASDSAYLNQVVVNGVLQQWVLKEDENHKHRGSITMNYDYFLNNSFEYGGQGFSFRVLSDWNRKSRTKLRTTIGAGPIVLAAVPDDYLYYGEGRNYDYGPGIGFNGGLSLNFNSRFLWSLDYRGGWFRTLNGNEASFYLNSFANEFRYFFKNGFSTGLDLGYLNLVGNYTHYDDTNKKYPYGRFSVGFRL